MNELRMLFMGRKENAANMLVWTLEQGINVVGVVTDSHLPNSPTAAVANRLKIPVLSLEEVEENMRKDNAWADIVVSYLFWKKLRSPLIDKPKYGCINFHPAILPDYRGMGGYNYAILDKLKEWGTTAHYVNESIDTGDIIDVFKFSFDYRLETAYSLENKTLKLQDDLYKSVVTRVMELGRLPATKQSMKEGRYISKKDMLDVMKIDFDSDDIDTKIQACWFPPYNGAYIEHNGKKYTLVNDYILSTLTKNNQTFKK